VAFRKPPLWMQFVLALGVAGLLLLALVIYVNDHNSSAEDEAAVNNPKVLVQENREARVIVGEDQAPHTAKLGAGSPAAGLRRALLAYMSHQIAIGTLGGPISGSSCHPAGGDPARMLYRCTVSAASVSYPFDGVVQPSARIVTYCKVDPPPVASMRIPVSARCT
jgi:hypothetical protein